MSITKQNILDYILHTPHNSNKKVLETLLDQYNGSEADTPDEKDTSGGVALKLIDWEGTVLKRYTKKEALALTELPLPSTLSKYAKVDHELLVFQEWNWSLSDIKNFVRQNEGFTLPVGAIYTTVDGENHEIRASEFYGVELTTLLGMDPVIVKKVGDFSTVFDFTQYTSEEDLLTNYQLVRYINIPYGTTSIGNYNLCKELYESQTDPPSDLDYLNMSPFAYCMALNNINLPSSIDDLVFDMQQNGAFRGISFPKAISNFMWACVDASLEEVVISNVNECLLLLIEVTTLGSFYFPKNFPAPIAIQDSEIYIYPGTKISLPNCLKDFTNVDNDQITGSWTVQSSTLKELEFPVNLIGLPNGTMSDCYALESVKFPNNLQTIGERCFTNCGSLKTIKFPDSLQYIGDHSFTNVPWNILELPQNIDIRQIGEESFTREYFKGVRVPTGIEEINIFETDIGDTGHHYISPVYIIEGKPAYDGTFSINYLFDIFFITIYVPRRNLSWFSTATNWSYLYALKRIVAIEDNIEELEELGFDMSDYK